MASLMATAHSHVSSTSGPCKLYRRCRDATSQPEGCSSSTWKQYAVPASNWHLHSWAAVGCQVVR